MIPWAINDQEASGLVSDATTMLCSVMFSWYNVLILIQTSDIVCTVTAVKLESPEHTRNAIKGNLHHATLITERIVKHCADRTLI